MTVNAESDATAAAGVQLGRRQVLIIMGGLKLLGEITHELAASSERPGRDLDAAGSATPR